MPVTALMLRVIAGSRRMPNGCREWQWHCDRTGYGRIKEGEQSHPAHRVTYAAVRGPVPAGLELDHLICDNRVCNDEWHVEPSTHRDNVLRGLSPAAEHARATHCVRGHKFTPENTYVYPNGRKRACRTCDRERHRG